MQKTDDCGWRECTASHACLHVAWTAGRASELGLCAELMQAGHTGVLQGTQPAAQASVQHAAGCRLLITPAASPSLAAPPPSLCRTRPGARWPTWAAAPLPATTTSCTATGSCSTCTAARRSWAAPPRRCSAWRCPPGSPPQGCATTGRRWTRCCPSTRAAQRSCARGRSTCCSWAASRWARVGSALGPAGAQVAPAVVHAAVQAALHPAVCPHNRCSRLEPVCTPS